MKCMLFLDPATACGFAVGTRGAMFSGEWDFRRKQSDAWAMTMIWLKQKMRELHKKVDFTHVGYEFSRAHKGSDAAHMHGAFVLAIQEVCLELGVTFEGVPVGTLKKFWTNKGNASKDDMVAEARRRGYEPDSDNEADAIAGWNWLMAAHEPVGSVEVREAAE